MHLSVLYDVLKSQGPSSNTFRDTNYFLVIFGPVQTTTTYYRQKVMHMSPPCQVHRWAQKLHLDLVDINFKVLYQIQNEGM